MDARTITAFALMILIYIFFFQPTVPPPVATNQIAITEQAPVVGKPAQTGATSASTAVEVNTELLEKRLVLENQDVRIECNALGQIKSVLFKTYRKTFSGKENVAFSFENDPLNRSYLLGPSGEPKWQMKTTSADRVVLEARDQELSYTREIKLVENQPYVLEIKESAKNNSKGLIKLNPEIKLYHPSAYETQKPGFWSTLIKPQTEIQQLGYYLDGSFHHLPINGIQNAVEKSGAFQFSGYSHRYFFMGAFPTDTSMTALSYRRAANKDIESILKFSEKQLPPGESTSFSYAVYLGPKLIPELNKLSPSAGEVVDYGSWIGPIARFLLGILNFFYGLIPNFGIAIILLTLVVKALLSPLAYKAAVSARRLQVLAPKMTEIREKYKEDKFRMQQEMMTLYKTEKVNPFGGCLPLLLQFPIFISLYRLFFVSIEMRHTPFFGWIRDLSDHDPYLVTPILMIALMWFQQKLTPMPPAMEDNEAVRMQRSMLKWMPLFFGGLMLFLPAGLNLYFLTNAGFSIVQQIYLNRRLEMKYPLPAGTKAKQAV